MQHDDPRDRALAQLFRRQATPPLPEGFAARLMLRAHVEKISEVPAVFPPALPARARPWVVIACLGLLVAGVGMGIVTPPKTVSTSTILSYYMPVDGELL